MANAKEIRTIIGIVGTVISSLISLSSQMPTFIHIYKKKSVEDYQPQHHLAMVINCSLWVLYGLPLVQNDSILISTTNGIRFVIEVTYVVVFLIYCGDKSRRVNICRCLAFEFLFVAFFYTVTILGFESLSSRHTFIGVVCNVFTIVMYALLVMKTVVKQDFKYMPAGLSFVSFINAGTWTAYGLIYKIDIYVLIINGLGTLFCASQLIANAYPHSTPAVNAAEGV